MIFKKEIVFEMTTMINAPTRPAWPTTQPVLKNRMMPRIVRTFGVNTPPNVPKRAVPLEELGTELVVIDQERRRGSGGGFRNFRRRFAAVSLSYHAGQSSLKMPKIS